MMPLQLTTEEVDFLFNKKKTLSTAVKLPSLLLVDDDRNFIARVTRFFRDKKYRIYQATTGQEALTTLDDTHIDIVLLDCEMPVMDGLTLLRLIRKGYPHVKTLMLVERGEIEIAVEAMKEGAFDCLEKPVSFGFLLTKVTQLWELCRLQQENQSPKSSIDLSLYQPFKRLVGESTPIRHLRQLIDQVGNTDTNVLILGETGTGKELVAQAIHQSSDRFKSPFIPVDCAAISEAVIESELFGHEKGSFIGAHTSTLGLIRAANGGTLFLDEIGELSPVIQSKITRTIQTKQVRPVGSLKMDIVDIRIIAATSHELAREVETGKFRKDLFFRLNVVTISVPPLRRHKEDILSLAQHFIDIYNLDPAEQKGLSVDTLKCLEAYSWPGNIRELENVIRRALTLSKSGILQPEDLPPEIYRFDKQRKLQSKVHTLEYYEKAALLKALKQTKYKGKKSARLLGIGEDALFQKLKKHNIL